MSKTVIHVNQHVIKANATKGEDAPPLTVKTYKDNRRAFEAIIRDREGREVARVINRPHDPLSCGARVWIETYAEVDVVTERDAPEASDLTVVTDEPESTHRAARQPESAAVRWDRIQAEIADIQALLTPTH